MTLVGNLGVKLIFGFKFGEKFKFFEISGFCQNWKLTKIIFAKFLTKKS